MDNKAKGIALGMVALALLATTTGCQRIIDGYRDGIGGFVGGGWGSYLTEAEADGAPAHAELATVGSGQVVGVWSESREAVVALEVLGGDFADVAAGNYAAGSDGMIVMGDLALEITLCDAPTPDEVVCVPLDATSIEISLLEDGARRVSYRAALAEGVAPVVIEGTFVVGR
ncbi:MAG: hypothetical protein M3Y87_19655 [Myxococcota bacterium]|nr:hypothetical protein [Myxococcota bacterium]